MQCRVSAAGRIGIRAVLQQQRRNVAVAAVGREHEGAHPIRLRIIRVCSGSQQQPRGLDVADPGGEQQWRGAAA